MLVSQTPLGQLRSSNSENEALSPARCLLIVSLPESSFGCVCLGLFELPLTIKGGGKSHSGSCYDLGGGDGGGRWGVSVSVYVCVFCQQSVFSQLWG